MDAVSTVAVLGLRAAPARSEEPVASAAPSPPCRNPPATEHQMLQSGYIETLRNITICSHSMSSRSTFIFLCVKRSNSSGGYKNYHWNKLENICAHVNGKSNNFYWNNITGSGCLRWARFRTLMGRQRNEWESMFWSCKRLYSLFLIAFFLSPKDCFSCWVPNYFNLFS